MNIIYFNGFWTIQDTKTYSDYLFLFGDNDQKIGKRGQAIIRDEPNAFGIPTKKKPYLSPCSYYSDQEYNENVKKIDKAFDELCRKLELGNYKGIILPENGIGTGLAKLPEKAPHTLQYIQSNLELLIENISQ